MIVNEISKLFSELISAILPILIAIIGFTYMIHGKPRDKIYTYKDRDNTRYYRKENLTKQLLKGLGIILIGLVLLGQI